jgi:hypothetical protein
VRSRVVSLPFPSAQTHRIFSLEKRASHLGSTGKWRHLMLRYMDRIRAAAQEAILMVGKDVVPGKGLGATLQRLLQSRSRGWYYSVSPLPFYAHDILVKEDRRMTNFQMEGVYTFDPEKALFFNHITGRHFLHSQEAPTLLSPDGRACFLALRTFDPNRPIPYSFAADDYSCRN